MHKEDAVANYFIILGLDENEEYMTNLRLNKLMYFAQAWNLALFGTPLFQERIEAWDYGPVVPSIYHQYKPYGKHPIEYVSPDFSLDIFSEEERALLSAVMAHYRKFSTSGLVDIAHVDSGPWHKAYNSTNKIISQDDIKAFFSTQPAIKLPEIDSTIQEAGYYNKADTYILPSDWNDEGSL